jgi:polysaccharide chain length determinant protein (PEP-CTERM system associated)
MEMIQQRQLTLDDYFRVLRRRWWVVVISGVIFALGGYGVSLLLQNKFTSVATLIIEQPVVPEDMVKAIGSTDLSARLEVMREQIMSRTRLQPLIERLGLYKDDVRKLPMEALVERMRQDIQLKAIRPVDLPTRLPGINISFTSDQARVSQQVCTEVVSMLVSDNLKSREVTAEGTTDFLTTELADAKRKLDEQDAKLAEFKRQHLGQLPGQDQQNLTMMANFTSQLDAITQNLARQNQEKTYVEGLLSTQLQAWKAQEAAQAAGTNAPPNLEQQISTIQQQLSVAEARYTPDYPDVLKLKAHLARLKKQQADLEKQAETQPVASSPKPDSLSKVEPASIQQLRRQLVVIGENIQELQAAQSSMQRQLRDYQGRIQLSPMIEEQYKQVTRDYDIAQKFYESLLSKKTLSQMSTNLERRQQGEQLRVIDPPNLPERPSFPNRPAMAAGGFGGGLMVGLGLIFLLEVLNRTIRSEADAEHYLKLPVLAMMPWYQEDQEEEVKGGWRLHRRVWKKRAKAVGA